MPHGSAGGTGTAGKALAIDFTVADSGGGSTKPQLVTLVDADQRGRQQLDIGVTIRCRAAPRSTSRRCLPGKSASAPTPTLRPSAASARPRWQQRLFHRIGAATHALAGDNSGNYTVVDAVVASHSAKATPYTGSGATGTAGATFTVAFTVTDSGGGSGNATAAISLSLINADTDKPISGYDPLPNGAKLDLATRPTRRRNIRANTDPASVGSVASLWTATVRTPLPVPHPTRSAATARATTACGHRRSAATA